MLEKVCVQTVESGTMTKDLAGCIHGLAKYVWLTGWGGRLPRGQAGCVRWPLASSWSPRPRGVYLHLGWAEATSRPALRAALLVPRGPCPQDPSSPSLYPAA